VIDGLELHYNGLFDLSDFLKAIDKYTSARGYSKSEKRRQETATPSGKELSMELRPAKIKTEYYSLMIKIRLNISNIRDVEILKNKAKLNEGDVTMVFDAWAVTDYKWRWEHRPVFYFLRSLADRLIYRFHTDKYYGELIDDTHYIHSNLKAYLNLHRYHQSKS
jgi:hypothetical protein